MSVRGQSVMRSGLLLGLIALLGTALLTGVNALTHERIAEQEKRRMLQQLNAILPAGSYDNELLHDRIEISDDAFLRHPGPVPVYRARMHGQPVAALMMVTAPDGYNGDIRILVGIDKDGVLLGARIIAHRETPGLGDPISQQKSDWILGFSGKSLQDPETAAWAVARDGGAFDQFTGATISPRAVVRTIRDSLLYFESNRAKLFDSREEPTAEHERG
jgi:electron transport complex protein RnfG